MKYDPTDKYKFMTKREWMVGQVISGLVSTPEFLVSAQALAVTLKKSTEQQLAKCALDVADAIFVELNK